MSIDRVLLLANKFAQKLEEEGEGPSDPTQQLSDLENTLRHMGGPMQEATRLSLELDKMASNMDSFEKTDGVRVFAQKIRNMTGSYYTLLHELKSIKG